MTTHAILQARMSSSRLPGKVLKPILGKPMLARQLERLALAQALDDVIVATSDDASDDVIAAICRDLGVSCFRGSLNDVLDRFHGAGMAYPAENIVRLTGDCPLVDPAIIDDLLALHLETRNDYTSNTVERTYPLGLDAEVTTWAALDRAWHEARLPSEREHVTPYLYKRTDLFRIGQLKRAEDLSGLRWTVDHPEDFELVTQVFAAIYPTNPRFGMDDVLTFLRKHPEVSALNSGVAPHEGYMRSLAQDREFEAGQGSDLPPA